MGVNGDGDFDNIEREKGIEGWFLEKGIEGWFLEKGIGGRFLEKRGF